MNNSQLVLVFTLFLFFTTKAVADTKTYYEDLNGDGKKETIKVEEIIDPKINFATESIITVLSEEKAKLGNFSMSEHFEEIVFISLNKDNTKQIVARSQSGMHYSNIAIYNVENYQLIKLFESGSGCGIESGLESSPPKLRIGIARLDKKGWSYADEPDWEVWMWDGNKFIKKGI